jgi:hypothetical protein
LIAVTIACSKESVKFSVGGDIGSGNVVMRHNASADKVSFPQVHIILVLHFFPSPKQGFLLSMHMCGLVIPGVRTILDFECLLHAKRLGVIFS